jgi:hypothetical protein
MVFNERIDHFQNLNIKSWHGLGVFFLRDGKIVELVRLYDRDRARVSSGSLT